MAFDKCPVCGYKESNTNHLVANTFNHYKHKTTGLVEVFSTNKPSITNDRGEWVLVSKVDGEWKESTAPVHSGKVPVVPINPKGAIKLDTSIKQSTAPIGQVTEEVVLPQAQL